MSEELNDHSSAMDYFDDKIGDMNAWVERLVSRKYKERVRDHPSMTPCRGDVDVWIAQAVRRWVEMEDAPEKIKEDQNESDSGGR